MASYYFSDSTGNDSTGNGSFATPYKSITKLNTLTLSAGDYVYFKRGDTFAGMIEPGDNGSSGSPITLSAYGEGARPIIDGSGEICGFYVSFDGNYYHHWRIEHLDFSGATYTPGNYYSCVVCNTHDMTWYDCIFRDSDTDPSGAENHGFSAWSNTGAEIYNIVIDHCYAYDNYSSGIMIGSGDGSHGPHDCEVKYCEAHDNGHTAFYDHGIYVAYGCTVHDCVCYNNSVGGGLKINCEGHISAYYPILYNNLTYDNYIGIYCVHLNAIVYNNVIYNNYYQFELDPDSDNMTIVFNTIVNAENTSGGCTFRLDGQFDNTVIKDNIIIQDQAVSARYIVRGIGSGDFAHFPAHNTFDYNVYYGDGNTATDLWYDVDATTLYNWTEWKALSGSPDAHSTFLTAVPDFNSRYTDFRIVDGGNLEGVGIALVGYTIDIQGYTRPDPPSPGAYSLPPSAPPDEGDGDGGEVVTPPVVISTASKYRMDVYDTSGALQYQLTDWTSLSYLLAVNAPGMVQFVVSGNHDLLSNIADKWQVEVWRKPAKTGVWAREITGLYRYLNWMQYELSHGNLICQGLMSMLGWRIVGFKAGVANRSTFSGVAAETIANTLVKYNCTATGSATRIRSGTISGLSVETNGGSGGTHDWNCAYDNLLESLQALCKLGDGDFDLVKTSPTTWQWRWYENQLGSDRSSSVIFSLERGNMAEPIFEDNRTDEVTAAIVGGQGEGTDRLVRTVTGTNYNATTNNIEVFVNATDCDVAAGLDTRGYTKLAENEAVKAFSFSVLQTPSCLYGVDYFLGDLVTAVNPFNDEAYTMKIQQVRVTLDESGAETIGVEMSEPL